MFLLLSFCSSLPEVETITINLYKEADKKKKKEKNILIGKFQTNEMQTNLVAGHMADIMPIWDEKRYPINHDHWILFTNSTLGNQTCL